MNFLEPNANKNELLQMYLETCFCVNVYINFILGYRGLFKPVFVLKSFLKTSLHVKYIL